MLIQGGHRTGLETGTPKTTGVLGLGTKIAGAWRRAQQRRHSGPSRVIAVLLSMVLSTIGVTALAVVTPAVAVASTATFAYVTNYSSGNVSVINTASNTVAATVAVGGNPDGVALTPNGEFAYVTSENSGYDNRDNVSVINTATNTVAATVAVGFNPVDVAITPNGEFAYVTNEYSDNVSVINTATNTVAATVAVGAPAGSPRAYPTAVAITPNGGFAYVVNGGDSSSVKGSVSVINTASNTVAATVPVGSLPGGVAITPDGQFAYVTDYGSGSVSVIDTASNAVATTVAVGSYPDGVAVTPNGELAYVTFGSGNVSVINTASNHVAATVTVGSYPHGVAVTPDGQFAYVTNVDSNNVSVIDTATNTVAATLAVGGDPNDVAIATVNVTPLTIGTSSLPGGGLGSAYSATLAAAGGVAPYQWSLGSGALPDGLSLDAATETISGTPTAAGTFSFTVQVSDTSGQSATQALSIVVPQDAPTITTTASGSVPAGGSASDTATVSGGYSPTGRVTFSLYAPGDTSCTTALSTTTAGLNASDSASSGNFAVGAAGTYRWVATYNGDSNNNMVVSGCGSESVTVTKATPAIATTASGSVPAGGSASDTATVSGGYSPTGRVTFSLYAPGDTSCTTALSTTTAGLNASDSASSGNFAVGASGTYHWVATYNGDSNNNMVVSGCGSESVMVTPQTLTGQAYGLSAIATLLGNTLVHVAPTPNTGAISTTMSSNTTTPCVATLSGLIRGHALCANVTTVAYPGKSTASASVADTTVGITAILPTITLKAVQSTSMTTCTASTGSTTIAYLAVGSTVLISQPTAIAPNTTIAVGAVKLVLNEQLPVTGADEGLTVNAAHITTNVAGLTAVNVIVASSESDIGNCP